jgi:hypothetical protein
MFQLAGCVVTAGRGKWPVVVSNFRGVDSSCWWPLEQYERASQVAQRLTRQLWESALKRPDPDAWPAASTDAKFVLEYLDACERLGIEDVGLITCAVAIDASYFVSSEWVGRLRAASSRLGIDVSFGSGHYSFINADSHIPSGPIRQYLHRNLNKNGLFESEDAARTFVQMHDRENELGANLETTEGALLLELWGEVALGTARKIVQEAVSAEGSTKPAGT